MPAWQKNTLAQLMLTTLTIRTHAPTCTPMGQVAMLVETVRSATFRGERFVTMVRALAHPTPTLWKKNFCSDSHWRCASIKLYSLTFQNTAYGEGKPLRWQVLVV